MKYEVIRSRRKTLGLQLTDSGIVVRAPYFVTASQIDRFVSDHYEWIKKQEALRKKRADSLACVKRMTPRQFETLKKLARVKVKERIAYYAPIAGVSEKVSKVFIRCQKTKWGSCSSSGNININCLLLLAPPEVLDAVIVHELCHLRKMDHSKQFYAHVLRVYPEYKKWYKWLKDNGRMLYAMLPEEEYNTEKKSLSR